MTDMKPTLSIVTATCNAAQHIPRLIASLEAQTDQDFEWVVADGGSTDGTLDILHSAANRLKNVKIDSRPDFGIYDALNRAVKMCNGDYYLVAGADDVFFSQAIADYRAAIAASGADLVTASIESGGCVRGPRKRQWPWLYGPFAFVSGHAIGVALRCKLHESYGYYSRHFPIAADQLFLLKVIRGGASVSIQKFVAGRFESALGTSGRDVLGNLLEGYRVQVAMGNSLMLQSLLVALRIIKNWHRIREGGR